ncbi:hypothetical protein [Fervidobacterium sp.]
MTDLAKEYKRPLELVLGPKGKKADPEVVREVIEHALSSPTASSWFKPLEDWVKASGNRELEEFFRLKALEKGLLSEAI